MSGSGRKAPGCPEVAGGPLRMSGSGWWTLRVLREWSVVSSGCQGDVGRPFRMSWSGLEALPNVREWSGGPPDVREWSGDPTGFAGVVGSQLRMSGRGREPPQMS